MIKMHTANEEEWVCHSIKPCHMEAWQDGKFSGYMDWHSHISHMHCRMGV